MEYWFDVIESVSATFFKPKNCLRFPRSYSIAYLLGGSMTFCDGIPKMTVATNSGVTFEEKLDAMNLAMYFFIIILVSFCKSTTFLCIVIVFPSNNNNNMRQNTIVFLTSTFSLSPGIKSSTEKNVSVLLKKIEAIIYYKAILIKFKHSSGNKKTMSVYKIWESKTN